MDEIDIWRTAKILIDSHGESAAMESAIRADHALEDGDPEGVAVWMRIMRAIEDLQRTSPKPGERIS